MLLPKIQDDRLHYLNTSSFSETYLIFLLPRKLDSNLLFTCCSESERISDSVHTERRSVVRGGNDDIGRRVSVVLLSGGCCGSGSICRSSFVPRAPALRPPETLCHP